MYALRRVRGHPAAHRHVNVAISGSRTFANRDLVWWVVERLLARGDFIIFGDAPTGVDKMVDDYFVQHPSFGRWRKEHAHWRELGRGAGHERNNRMIAQADALVALFADGERTPGTSDALKQAMKRRIPTFVYHEGSWLLEALRERKARAAFMSPDPD